MRFVGELYKVELLKERHVIEVRWQYVEGVEGRGRGNLILCKVFYFRVSI